MSIPRNENGGTFIVNTDALCSTGIIVSVATAGSFWLNTLAIEAIAAGDASGDAEPGVFERIREKHGLGREASL